MNTIRKAIYALSAITALSACQEAEEQPAAAEWRPDDIYIAVDMAGAESRVAYHIEENYFDEGNFAARWEIGDIIKVYEAVEDANTLTHAYSCYTDYERKYEFPAAPTHDKYYRFECVGGEGTAHGIFKYIGLATADVVGGSDGTYNVNVDVTYNQQINNWENFDGVVIYGNPLRNYMMRHQEKNGDWTHLKYGQRMRGHLCNYNFLDWSKNDGTYGYIDGFVLYNTASCIYKIVMDGFEDDIYGGATMTLKIPGVTSGHSHVYINPEDITEYPCYRNYPMTLTLGNKFDHQERQDPWCYGKNSTNVPTGGTRQITAYIIGWGGFVDKNAEIEVEFIDHFYGKKYTWILSKDEEIEFAESHYYTFLLTTAEGNSPTSIVADESLQTSP